MAEKDKIKGIVLENRDGYCAVLTEDGSIERLRGEHPVGASVVLSAVSAAPETGKPVIKRPIFAHRTVRFVQIAAVAAAALLVALLGTRADRWTVGESDKAPRVADAGDLGQDTLGSAANDHAHGEQGLNGTADDGLVLTDRAETEGASSDPAKGNTRADDSSVKGGESRSEASSGDQNGSSDKNGASVEKQVDRETAANGVSLVEKSFSGKTDENKGAADPSQFRSTPASDTKTGGNGGTSEQKDNNAKKSGSNKKKTTQEPTEGSTVPGDSSGGASTTPGNPPRQKEEPGTGASEGTPVETSLADAGASTEPDPSVPEITPAAPSGESNTGESSEQPGETVTTPETPPETPAPQPDPGTGAETPDNTEDTSNAGAGSGSSEKAHTQDSTADSGTGN